MSISRFVNDGSMDPPKLEVRPHSSAPFNPSVTTIRSSSGEASRREGVGRVVLG